MRIVTLGLLFAMALPGAVSAQTSKADSAARDSMPKTASRARRCLFPNANPFPSTYKAFPSAPPSLPNATILTAAGPRITRGLRVRRLGRSRRSARQVAAPADAVVIDGTGKYVTPGIIDTHSPSRRLFRPRRRAQSDGNEATGPNTPYVWAEHSVWPQDPQFPRNLAGGVTTLQVLPGSANLFGGREWC